jgi:hypothetical protein
MSIPPLCNGHPSIFSDSGGLCIGQPSAFAGAGLCIGQLSAFAGAGLCIGHPSGEGGAAEGGRIRVPPKEFHIKHTLERDSQYSGEIRKCVGVPLAPPFFCSILHGERVEKGQQTTKIGRRKVTNNLTEGVALNDVLFVAFDWTLLLFSFIFEHFPKSHLVGWGGSPGECIVRLLTSPPCVLHRASFALLGGKRFFFFSRSGIILVAGCSVFKALMDLSKLLARTGPPISTRSYPFCVWFLMLPQAHLRVKFGSLCAFFLFAALTMNHSFSFVQS